jgi:hypothetical protein
VFKATDAALLTALNSGNALHRLHATEELVRRGAKPATVSRLRQAIADGKRTADARAAAIFTLKQLQGAKANDALVKAASATDARVRETALRALADRTDQLQGATPALYVKALSDADAQVQIQGIRGLVRLGARNAADAILPLTGSSDQGISHLAVNALVSLGASSTALEGLDGSAEVRTGALRALAQMYDPATVTALTDRLSKAGDASSRAALVHALARLSNREAPWKGDWWTTRPAHLGPYFDPTASEESPRIRAALGKTLVAVSGDEFTALANDLALNQALPRGAQPLLAAVPAGDPLRAQLIESLVGRSQLDPATLSVATQLDTKSPELHAAVAQLLAGESTLGASALPLARNAALDAKLDPKIRGALLSAIGQAPGQSSLDVAAEVFARLNPVPAAGASVTPAGAPSAAAGGAVGADPVETAWRRFVGDRRRMTELDYFITMAKTAPQAQRTLAYAVLVQSVRTPRTPAPVREKVAPAIDAAWADPASAPSLVQAIGLMRVESQYTDKLTAYNQTKGQTKDK